MHDLYLRPELKQDHPLNLSISIIECARRSEKEPSSQAQARL
jgi:hypothetical protein